MAKKTKQIGGISFGSQEAYENFLTLPREEQLKQVAASFSPKDEARADVALKGVKNGDSSTTKQEATGDNATAVAEGNGKDNTAKSGKANATKG